MSEKRKSDITILLKKRGKKTSTIELFEKEQWVHSFSRKQEYRIRVNGSWFPFKDQKPYNGVIYYDKWKIRDLIWRSFKF